MCLQVRYLLLHVNRVWNNLLLTFLRLDTNLEDFIDDFFEILNQIVMLILSVLISLVYDADEDLPIVLEGSSESFQIVVDLLK